MSFFFTKYPAKNIAKETNIIETVVTSLKTIPNKSNKITNGYATPIIGTVNTSEVNSIKIAKGDAANIGNAAAKTALDNQNIKYSISQFFDLFFTAKNNNSSQDLKNIQE